MPMVPKAENIKAKRTFIILFKNKNCDICADCSGVIDDIVK